MVDNEGRAANYLFYFAVLLYNSAISLGLAHQIVSPTTKNAQFLVGVTEALCCGDLLANSGLAPGLHRVACVGSRPTSPPSVTSATNTVAATAASPGRGDGGCKGGRGMSDADVGALRGATLSMARNMFSCFVVSVSAPLFYFRFDVSGWS